MNFEYQVTQLEHREAIKELRYNYHRCIGQQRLDELINLFTTDATCTYASVGAFYGHNELRELTDDFIPANFVYLHRLFHHSTIDIDGDTGTGTRLLKAMMTYDDGQMEWRQSQCKDTYRLVDGGSKISSITLYSYGRS